LSALPRPMARRTGNPFLGVPLPYFFFGFQAPIAMKPDPTPRIYQTGSGSEAKF
jgi:hypothetical protein